MREFIIADNQDITKAGMMFLLSKQKDTSLLLEADNKAELIQQLRLHPAAVVILDYTLFDFSGAEELIVLHERFKETDWLLFSDELSIPFLRQVLFSSMAFGVILKDNSKEEILTILKKYGISNTEVLLWGTGTPLREFLWSEEMADASVHVLLNVDFKDTYAPDSKEIRNCHINVGTGKELSIKEVAEKIIAEIGFKGELRWDASKPDGTLRKLTDVTKLHNLGWHHKIEIDEGIHRLYEWYLKGICINHQTN